jgi:hypothetical protein
MLHDLRNANALLGLNRVSLRSCSVNVIIIVTMINLAEMPEALEFNKAK